LPRARITGVSGANGRHLYELEAFAIEIPEPAAFGLMALSGLGLLWRRRVR
jgi:hypothetical protein